ncbi:MAG: hypothetical protein HZC10_00040 [Nitrospirae bacterium]|nr:hypothetical protein [Nitrospirota bacterium]
MRIKVKAYSGYKAEERPISFSIGKKELRIEELLDRWYGKDYEYFKLRADDRCIYIIRYNRDEDFWELVMMEEEKA